MSFYTHPKSTPIANKHFAGDRTQAVQYIESGGSSLVQDKAEFIEGQKSGWEEFVKGAGHVLTDQEISAYQSKISNDITPSHIEAVRAEANEYGLRSVEAIDQERQEMTSDVERMLNKNSSEIKKLERDNENYRQKLEQQHKAENKKTNLRLAAGKAIGDIKTSWSND